MSEANHAPNTAPMTVDEFLAWAEDQDGRYELLDGQVYAMAPERAGHAKAKFAVQAALADGIRKAGLPCHMLPNGMTVRTGESTAHEPDALVYCGPELPASAIEVPDPVIIVEVLSPSTRRNDAVRKLAGYFSLPSVHHYLIVAPERLPAIHHQRQSDGTILTRLFSEGTLRFEPPRLRDRNRPIAGLNAAPFDGRGAAFCLGSKPGLPVCSRSHAHQVGFRIS